MAYFDFSRLIKKYSSPFTVFVKSGGGYDDKGDWKEGESKELELNGAVMAMSARKVYNSNGIYTTKDKVLYMLQPLDNALIGCEIVFLSNKYKIETEEGADNSVFTGVYSYILKWVSAFGGGSND